VTNTLMQASRCFIRFLLVAVVSAVLGPDGAQAQQNTIQGNNVLLGTWNSGQAAHTAVNRSGVGSPSGRDSCLWLGESYFQTDATPGQNLWYATALGYPCTWTNGNSGGVGTVTSVSASCPTWITCPIATPTTTPALTIGAAIEQISHQVIGTCGSATSFGPCTLGTADLPSSVLLSGGALGTPSGGSAANLTGYPSSALAGAVPRSLGGLNSTAAGTGILRDGTTPAASELSGDATTSGSNAVTVVGLNGQNLAALGYGLMLNQTNGVPALAPVTTDASGDLTVPGNLAVSGTATITNGTAAACIGLGTTNAANTISHCAPGTGVTQTLTDPAAAPSTITSAQGQVVSGFTSGGQHTFLQGLYWNPLSGDTDHLMVGTGAGDNGSGNTITVDGPMYGGCTNGAACQGGVTVGGNLVTMKNGAIGWTSTTGIAAVSTGFTRDSTGGTGYIDCGTGAANDKTCTFSYTNGIRQLGGLDECTHGSNATCGVSTLASGTVTVSTTAIATLAAAGSAGDAVRLTLISCSSCGSLSVGTVTSGTSFVINSTNGSDASKVFWEIIKIN